MQFLIVKNAYPEKRPHCSLPQYSEKTVIKLMDVFSMGHVCCQQYDHMVRLLIQYVATTNNENLPNGIKNLTNQIQIYSNRVKFRQIWSHCWCGKWSLYQLNHTQCLKWWESIDKLVSEKRRGCGGLVVSMLSFYSDYTSFLCVLLFEKKENEQIEAQVGSLKRNLFQKSVDLSKCGSYL